MQSFTSAAIIWLSMLAISTAISVAMLASVLTSGSLAAPAVASPGLAATCDTPGNWQLIYAQTTGRVPATYCPDR